MQWPKPRITEKKLEENGYTHVGNFADGKIYRNCRYTVLITGKGPNFIIDTMYRNKNN